MFTLITNQATPQENDEEVTLVLVLQTTKKLPTILIHFKKLNTFEVLIKF